MARVTVEDCITLVPNRFELVMISAHRAREIASGAQIQVERDRDKNPVVALREIADEKVELDVLKEALVKGYQRRVETESSEEELKELMAEEQKWASAAAAMAEGMREADEEAEEDGDVAADEELAEVDEDEEGAPEGMSGEAAEPAGEEEV